jgi:hypothetical protein
MVLVMRYCRQIVFLLVLSFGLIWCQDEKPELILDPNTLNDPEPHWPMVLDNVLEEPVAWDSLFPLDTTAVVTEGYRVQVLATHSAQKADSLRSLLEEKIHDPVYVVFETPNYKVRVGDYLSRSQAEAQQAKLVKLGYPNAWILRSRIKPQNVQVSWPLAD